MMLKSRRVAAAFDVTSSRFDPHWSLDTINCQFGLHLANVNRLNHFLVKRVIDRALTACQDYINTLNPCAYGHDVPAILR